MAEGPAMSGPRLDVLLIAPNCDGTDVGEAFCAHRWTQHLSAVANVTLLTQLRPGRLPASAQLPHARVIEWPEPQLPRRLERVTAMLKPGYPVFAARARRWIGEELRAGRRFDIIHQLTPLALRYASPAQGFGIPYVLGPHAGSLTTPTAFTAECRSAPLFTRLRQIDRFRLEADPWLRRSFANASCIIGVAPYVRDVLGSIPVKRFEVMTELGVDEPLPPMRATSETPGLRLLHVARAVRTKGLRDGIRAMAHLRDLSGVTLTQAGDGEELALCRAEAKRLGVESRVNFLGRIPRQQVEELYATSDAFLFPSFREPSGSVVFEAMRHGLPVIAAGRGGPGHVVDGGSGFKVPVDSPDQLALALATAVRRLADSPEERARLSAGARRRALELGSWPTKVNWLLDLYHSILRAQGNATRTAS
jgi:glycosyltransferase involved in cell wall biosynthesis